MNDLLREALDQWTIDSMAACAGYDARMMERLNEAVERAEKNAEQTEGNNAQ